MANVCVEARPKGRPEGSAIDGYVVEDRADHSLGEFRTQQEALIGRSARGIAHLSRGKEPERQEET